MTESQILEILTRILRGVLADDTIVLTMETERSEVPNWDSFAYVNFIVAAEMELGVRFKVADVESFENVGAIVRAAKGMLP